MDFSMVMSGVNCLVGALNVSGFVPAPLNFALWWLSLGFLSSCLMGCGGAFLLMYLLPFVEAGEDGSNIAVFCYGIGSVLGEVPVYFIAEELFRPTRLALQRKRCSCKTLTSLHSLVSSAPYVSVLVFSACSVLPIDITAILCAVLNVTFPDFFLPAIVGKGLFRTQFLLAFFRLSCVKQYIPELTPPSEGTAELAFAFTAFTGVVTLLIWLVNFRGDSEILLDDE
eukprot:TRINITY_DN2159_c0_g2_i1.p1 TRINITY_DN2159_c0_g2~~TRINITY_DN2159_c0_g2_i1.p1  ORF type:complete len:241 (+),score=31.23 TRINITY_DN2159_c0_g2_i1:47-724(+)